MTDLPPIVQSIEVVAPTEEAFRVFTESMGAWWPVKTHSVGQEHVADVVLEARVEGDFYEVWDDGSRVPWGKVLAWEPPRRLVVSWHPGFDPAESTEVEVTFAPTQNGTLVELTHRNWERRGEHAPEKRAQYEAGWPITMERFRDEVVRSSAGAAP